MVFVSLPNSGQSLGQTRAAIKNNFDLIKTTVDQNHLDFDVAGAGKHYAIQIPITGATPPGGFVVGDANLYARNSDTQSQVIFKPDASVNEYQLTRANDTYFATFATNTGYLANHTGGWTFLPGGMLLQYGARAVPGNNGVITFPRPFTNAAYSVQLSISVSDNNERTVGVNRNLLPTNTTINYVCSSGGNDFVYWYAIGV